MKTDDLIALLAADPARPGWPSYRTQVAGVASAVIGSAALLFFVLGLREDLAAALSGFRFPFKLAFTAALALGSLSLLGAAARPGGIRTRDFMRLAPAGALLVCGVAFELAASPPSIWFGLALGQNAPQCLVSVPLLSLPALISAFVVLGKGAPTDFPAAGAAAGLFAAGIGTGFYALHCPDDSPLFVAIWYVAAAAVVTVPSALAARAALRW